MTADTEDRLRVATLHLAQAISKVAQAIALVDARQKGGRPGLLFGLPPVGEPSDAIAEAYASLDKAVHALGETK